MYNVFMDYSDLLTTIKTKEEKKILQKLLVEYRSFLIRRAREMKKQKEAMISSTVTSILIVMGRAKSIFSLQIKQGILSNL